MSLASSRAAYEAKVRAEFTPKVPGIPGDGSPVILHVDTARDLTYTWHDRSFDINDAPPRRSGIETSLLTVTRAGHRLGYLKVSFTTKEHVASLFASPFEWADENTGACFGFSFAEEGHPVSPEKIWATAYTNLRMSPPSLDGRRVWVPSPSDAPSDPKVLAAELAVVEKVYAKKMRGFIRTFAVPFVAYSHVDGEFEAQQVGHPGSLRGEGVGRMMYLLAAQQLATTGRVLRASGNQTPEASALWQRLVSDPEVPTRKSRVTYYRTGEASTRWCIDYTRVDR